jgi:hypothetical protein
MDKDTMSNETLTPQPNNSDVVSRRVALPSDHFELIKALHAEFEKYGMMSSDWGAMAHEHRALLIAEVERLRYLIAK